MRQSDSGRKRNARKKAGHIGPDRIARRHRNADRCQIVRCESAICEQFFRKLRKSLCVKKYRVTLPKSARAVRYRQQPTDIGKYLPV